MENIIFILIRIRAECVCCWDMLQTGCQANTLGIVNSFILFRECAWAVLMQTDCKANMKTRNYDFPPEFSFKNDEILACLESTKLLGIYLTSDLRWKENCDQLFMKAMSEIWLLRRLK